MEEAVLIQNCQNGDKTAFEQLFHRYKEQVYNVAYRMTNNREDALDLTQEIFLRAYHKINKFNFRSAFSTWLYKLAVNFCIDEHRKRKPVTESLSIGAKSLVERRTPEDDAISNERKMQIWEAINSLKAEDRAMVILRDMEGLPYEEIAKILRCSIARVKSRLHEARQKLREILKTETGSRAD